MHKLSTTGHEVQVCGSGEQGHGSREVRQSRVLPSIALDLTGS